MSFNQHIFYDVHALNVNVKQQIIMTAKNLASKWWVDKLDCKQSFARQTTDMSFDNIMKKFNNKTHFIVIHRRGHENPWHGEIGFSTRNINEPDYFLWVLINEKNLYKIVEQYQLKKMT